MSSVPGTERGADATTAAAADTALGPALEPDASVGPTLDPDAGEDDEAVNSAEISSRQPCQKSSRARDSPPSSKAWLGCLPPSSPCQSKC
jgi:hypothetical protein